MTESNEDVCLLRILSCIRVNMQIHKLTKELNLKEIFERILECLIDFSNLKQKLQQSRFNRL